MRRAYLLVGGALVVVAILGFLGNPLVGLFELNVLHNFIHLASGAVTLLAARIGIGAIRLGGKVLGLFYLASTIGGFALPGGDAFGLMHLNRADNLLHAGLSAVFLYYGLLAPPRL